MHDPRSAQDGSTSSEKCTPGNQDMLLRFSVMIIFEINPIPTNTNPISTQIDCENNKVVFHGNGEFDTLYLIHILQLGSVHK